MEMTADAKRMKRLEMLLIEGAFAPVIDSIHPLSDAAAAFDRQQESGKRGKILLEFIDAN